MSALITAVAGGNVDGELVEARRAAQELFAEQFKAGWLPKGIDTYRAADGTVLFHRVRFDAPPGSTAQKFIRPIHHDGTRWRVGEPAAPPQGKALYLLPELLKASAAQPVYVVEGEKAARALQRLGLVVTTSGGATSAPGADWSPLRGRRVRIWPDHDAPGQRYATEVADLARLVASSVEILDLTALRLPDKGDAYDWRVANPGASAADVEALPWRPAVTPTQLAAAARIPRLRTICAADIVPEPVRWLWPGRIAIGNLTLIAGDPGLGKSTLTVRLAAHVTRGTPWPVDGAPCPLASVLMVSAEDNYATTIRPRLDAAGADNSRVEIFDAVEVPDDGDHTLCLQTHQKSIALFLDEHPDVRLIIIDPISSFLGQVDSHKNTDVRGLLHPLGQLASKYRVAIVAVSHLNKGGVGAGSALYRVSGSLAFVAAARASFLVTKDKADPDRRLVLPAKNNLGPDSGGVAYRITLDSNEISRVEWEEQAVTLSADQALSPGSGDDGEFHDVSTWIREMLSGGPLPARQMQLEAENLGIHWRKAQRAMKAAGVESVREGFGRDARYIWRFKGGRKPG